MWGTAKGMDEEGMLLFRADGAKREKRLHSGEIVQFER